MLARIARMPRAQTRPRAAISWRLVSDYMEDGLAPKKDCSDFADAGGSVDPDYGEPRSVSPGENRSVTGPTRRLGEPAGEMLKQRCQCFLFHSAPSPRSARAAVRRDSRLAADFITPATAAAYEIFGGKLARRCKRSHDGRLHTVRQPAGLIPASVAPRTY